MTVSVHRVLASRALLVALLVPAACRPVARAPAPPPTTEPSLSLAGTWQVRIDDDDRGLDDGWADAALRETDPVALPGSLAESGLGHRFDPVTGRYPGLDRLPLLAWPSAGYTDRHRRDELGALVPSFATYGPAWFERVVDVPSAVADRPLRLVLERVKGSSGAWVDGRPVPGSCTDSLHTPHVHDLGVLAAGAHRLTLRIDNRPPVPIGFAGHGYGLETEPLWLGVAGRLDLVALDSVRVEHATVAPTADPRRIRAALTVAGAAALRADAMLSIELVEHDGDRVLGRSSEPLRAADRERVVELPLREPARAWDEFTPELYELRWTIRDATGVRHRGARRVGLRSLARDGRRILLNGAPLFLRGTLECAIHPSQPTPPADRGFWERALGIHREAGFNHVRFHTWCPPDVAFEVADELGLLLQVETAYWVDDWIADTPPFPPPLGVDPATDAWVEAEALRIVRTFAHHPSFALFCIGNEFGDRRSDWDVVERITARLGSATDHALVAGTTARRRVAADQYRVTHRTTAPVRGLGAAHTDWDFGAGVAAAELPVIAHETGQRPSWPDYDALLPRFRGVAQPWNLRRLRAAAEAAGCVDHARRAAASARRALALYKHEHEALRRTAGLAGYQLLMLHDFTGQGEAHVGLLDAFLFPKPGVELAAVRAWNGPTVPLARFGAFTWTTAQTFEARLLVAHDGPAPLRGVRPRWELRTAAGRTVAGGELAAQDVATGARTALGEVAVPLAGVAAPVALTFSLAVGGFENRWNLWVYPPAAPVGSPAGVHVARHLDAGARQHLAQGGTVLLLPHGTVLPQARSLRWEGTYWSGAWGWGDGLGLLVDAEHPALAGFPTADHSDWQWRELVEGGLGVALPAAVADAGGIVEHIADFHRPAREACVFEVGVGPGRLVVCGFDLESDLAGRHAARALRASLLRYAASPAWVPKARLTVEEAAELLGAVRFGAGDVVAVQADSAADGHGPDRVLDGDPRTIWHTPWGADEPPCPHHLDLDLGAPRAIAGLHLLPRQDGDHGRIAEVAVQVRGDGGEWGAPVVIAELGPGPGVQTLRFAPVTARFVRIVARREVAGRPWSSLAEVGVVFADGSGAQGPGR